MLVALTICAGACSCSCSSDKKQPVKLPQTPEQAISELRRAAGAGDAKRVYQLLDQTSRWSLMSIYRDLRSACALVRNHYPRARQVRELERCQAADQAADAEAYFVQLAARRRLLASLKGTAAGSDTLGGALVREGGSWAYSGLRATLNTIKVKVRRDLQSIRESAETFKQGR